MSFFSDGNDAYAMENLLKAVDDLQEKIRVDRKYERTTDVELPKDLQRMIGRLWPEVIRAGLVKGTDPTSEVNDRHDSTFTVAIRFLAKSAHEVWQGPREETEDPNRIFNPFAYFLDIEGLLFSGNHNLEGNIFNVHRQVGRIIVAIQHFQRNHDLDADDLLDLCRNIQGYCFSIFKHDECFLRAYFVHHIALKIYGFEARVDDREYVWVGSGDKVALWLGKATMHHDLSRPMKDRDDVVALEQKFLEILKHEARVRKVPDPLRVRLALELAGREFHYPHKLKELFDSVKLPAKWKTVIREQFNENVKAKKKREESTHHEYEDDKFLDRSHPWGIYRR